MSGEKRPNHDTHTSNPSKRRKEPKQQSHKERTSTCRTSSSPSSVHPSPSTSKERSHETPQAQAQHSAPGCKHCQEKIITQQQLVVNLDGDLEDLVGKKRDILDEFYRKINALVNSKGGTVVIHATNPHRLGLLDQKIDKKLSDQITTGVLYQHVFRRSFYDECHILYEVNVFSDERPLGALQVNSAVSHNKGKERLSYKQTSFLLDEFKKERVPKIVNDKREFTFIESEEVFITSKPPGREEVKEPFQESAFIQAKEVREGRKKKFSTKELVEYCWKHLPEYISAFTKSEDVGYVLFGVSEATETQKKWSLVSEHPCVDITEHGKEELWQLWGKEGAPSVLHAAKLENVECNEHKTGTFNAASVYLPKIYHSKFREDILKKIDTDMLWVTLDASEYSNPVEVDFREVDGASRDNCVIEVKIKYFHGFCFHNKEGPDAYYMRGHNSVEPDRADVEKWLKSFGVKCNMKVWPERIV